MPIATAPDLAAVNAAPQTVRTAANKGGQMYAPEDTMSPSDGYKVLTFPRGKKCAVKARAGRALSAVACAAFVPA